MPQNEKNKHFYIGRVCVPDEQSLVIFAWLFSSCSSQRTILADIFDFSHSFDMTSLYVHGICDFSTVSIHQSMVRNHRSWQSVVVQNDWFALTSVTGKFVCHHCGLNTNRSKIRWLKHMKRDHEVSYTRLLDEAREHGREANMPNRAVASIRNVDEVRQISRRQKMHRLFRYIRTISQMGGQRRGKTDWNAPRWSVPMVVAVRIRSWEIIGISWKEGISIRVFPRRTSYRKLKMEIWRAKVKNVHSNLETSSGKSQLNSTFKSYATVERVELYSMCDLSRSYTLIY
jgi:hypothetical protein